MLSRHSLLVRRVHVVPATSLHVLRDERDRPVYSAVRTRHGRLLSAAGRRREDLARYDDGGSRSVSPCCSPTPCSY